MLLLASRSGRVGVGIYVLAATAKACHNDSVTARCDAAPTRCANSIRNKSLKALQNTGPRDFRQSYFVDTRYTHGYSSWFLTVTAGIREEFVKVVWDEGA